MAEKHTDNTKYKHSHKKSVKSCEKHLTRNKVSGKIHSFTASQLHSFTADGFLCPNKTIKQSQIFSHKKVCSTDWNNSQILYGVSKGDTPLETPIYG